MYYHHYCWLA